MTFPPLPIQTPNQLCARPSSDVHAAPPWNEKTGSSPLGSLSIVS